MLIINTFRIRFSREVFTTMSVILLLCTLACSFAAISGTISIKFDPPPSPTQYIFDPSNVDLTWYYKVTRTSSKSTIKFSAEINGKYQDFLVFTASGANIEFPNTPYNGRVTWSKNISFASIRIKNLTSDDYTKYRISIGYISLADDAVSIIALEKGVEPTKPSITCGAQKEIFNITLREDDDLECSCSSTGLPLPFVEWKIPGMRSNHSVLKKKNVSRNETNVYTCVASNQYGFQNESVLEINVQYPPSLPKITSRKKSSFVGEKVSFTCTADGDPTPEYTWKTPDNITSHGSNIFVVALHNSSQFGVYSCTARNLHGNNTANITLRQLFPPEITGGFPKDQIVDAIEGRNYFVDCLAMGKPAPNIIWHFRGSPLSNQPKTYIIGELLNKIVQSKSTLALSPAKREDNGIYTCEAKNRYGSSTAKVTLNLMYRPVVTNKNDFKQREVKKGEDVKLNCIAKGNPAATYYVWRWENGTVIQNKTNGELKFVDIEGDQGRLSCAAGSYIGEGQKQYVDIFVRVKTEPLSIEIILLCVGGFLAIVLVVLFGILIYKRRYHTQKSTSVNVPVDAIEMRIHAFEEPMNNILESDNEARAAGPTAPYEEVHIYTEPDFDLHREDKRTTNCQIPADYKIAIYEKAQMPSTSSGYTDLDIRRQDERENNYQHLLEHDSGYLVPADSGISPCEEAQMPSTSANYTELDIRRQDERENNYQHLLKKHKYPHRAPRMNRQDEKKQNMPTIHY